MKEIKKFCKVLTRKQGKMCIHEFEKQTASNLFENAIRTFQAKQSVFFILLFVVFFFSADTVLP